MASRNRKSKECSKAWWQEKSGSEHDAANAWINSCRTELKKYRSDVLYWMSLYQGSADLTGTGRMTSGATNDKIVYNLTASVVDTAISIVGAARTLPYHLPRSGNWSTQRKAKNRTACLQSQFQDLRVFDHGTQVILDGMVGCIGALHFFVDPDTQLPGAERVLPLELSWNPTEALAGEPRTLGRSKAVAREVLAAMFPKKAADIEYAKGPSSLDEEDFVLQRDGKADQVAVHEVWHLPSKSGADDGRHVIFTDNCTLFSESWDRPRFPFAFYRWSQRQIGFLGKSLVDEVEPAQKRVENLIKYIETCQDLCSKPQTWIEASSEVEATQIDNIPGSVNRYRGPNPPTFFTFDATPHDLEATIDRYRERVLAQLGLSTLQTSGEKPAGVTSAIGMQTVDDLASRRHVQNIRQVEAFYLQCAQALSDVNDEVAEKRTDFAIDRRIRSQFLDSMKWTEVQVKNADDMKMCVYPVSQLPTSPAGQQEKIAEWVRSTFVSRDAAMALQGLPDTEAYSNVETAHLSFAEMQAEMLLDGKRVSIDPHQNLGVAVDLIVKHYLAARQDGADDAVLNNFRLFLQQAKAAVQAATPPAAPAPSPSTPLVSGAPLAGQMPVGPNMGMPLA